MAGGRCPKWRAHSATARELRFDPYAKYHIHLCPVWGAFWRIRIKTQTGEVAGGGTVSEAAVDLVAHHTDEAIPVWRFAHREEDDIRIAQHGSKPLGTGAEHHVPQLAVDNRALEVAV